MPRSRRDRERADEQDSYSFDFDPSASSSLYQGVQLNPDGTPCRACTSVQDVKQRLGEAFGATNQSDCAPDANQIGNAGWVPKIFSSAYFYIYKRQFYTRWPRIILKSRLPRRKPL